MGDLNSNTRESHESPSREVAGLLFSMSSKRFGRTVRLRARGELEVASKEDFKTCLNTALSEPLDSLVLDLSELVFIDSIGLKAIFDLCNRASKEGFAFSVIPGGRQVQRAFDISGLEQLIEGGLARDPRASVAGEAKGYLHCPECRTPVYSTDSRPPEACPNCSAQLEPSPPSMFRGSVRHPGLAVEADPEPQP